jgi:hypothetical protein
MADLKKYIWEGVKTGMPFDLYYSSWAKIGSATAETAESLHIKLKCHGKILGNEFNFTIEIVMPDTSPSGKCTVILNGSREDGCLYKVDNDTLIIHYTKTEIKIKGNDKSWTWIGINNPLPIWIGAWPAKLNIDKDYLFKDAE